MLMDKTPEINYNELKFIPISAEGFAFVTNVTKLNLLGLPTEDVNQDGLIDSVDTWEKIFALKDMWESQNDKVFPIALNEPYSFYAFLSAGGFNIFKTHQATQAGFDSLEFTESLNFIQKLASINWIKAENNASSAYTWMYDQSLIDDNFIFTLAGSWMNVNEFDLTHPTEWSVSAFPTYNGKNLNPLIKLSGFSINRNTYYPSAASELIRILKSIKGMQLLIDHSSLVPLVNDTYMDYLEYPNSHISQFIQSFQNGYTEPIIAFEHNPSKLAFSVYYEIELMSSIRALWDQTLSVQQTQAQIVQNVINQTAILDTEESGN
jgi:arabinogalactan oligomer/maltooligosaccharide transport system substrate-binding protein